MTRTAFSALTLASMISIAASAFGVAAGGDELDRRIDDVAARVDRSRPWKTADSRTVSVATERQGEARAAAHRGGRRGGWKFAFTPVFWAPGMDGNLEVAGQDVDVDVSIWDGLETTFENFEFATMGRFEANHCKWSLILDFFYVGIGNEDDLNVGATQVDFEWDQDQVILEGLVGYRFAELPLGCGNGCFQPTVAFDALAGARFYYLGIDLDLDPGPSFCGDECWIDPVVGARAIFSITPNFALAVHGDIGGFGIGSDLSWRISAGIDYRVARCVSLNAGWIVIDTDYEDGSFAYDVTLSGPYVGATFRF